MIGDSYTMGSGVRGKKHTLRSSKRPSRAPGPRDHEVINLGLSGLSLAGSSTSAHPLRPRLLAGHDRLRFTINDLEAPITSR